VLLHHPIKNRHGKIVTTAVTNMDIHDISRTAKTYGASQYFVVTPIEEQHELIGRILNHWNQDSVKEGHPDRVKAVSLVQMSYSFKQVKEAIAKEHGVEPIVVLTSAQAKPESVTYEDFRKELRELQSDPRPVVLVFGTGWGIADSFFPEVDRTLAPIYGPEGDQGYNHLSVRSAVATVCDRLFGR